VTKIWQQMTKKVVGGGITSCCSSLGSETQSSGIPGVYCSSEGNVRQIIWNDQYFTAEISPLIGNLLDLEVL
jgi:hypothetical protein